MRNFKALDVKIQKIFIEWIVIIIVMMLSFINDISFLIALMISLTLLKQKEIGAIKILNLITFRTVINPGIAVGIGNWQNVKWMIIFLCSFYLLRTYFKMSQNQRGKIKKIVYLVLLFAVYNIVIALFFSTLPTIAIFKLLSYVIVFLGVFIGINYTSGNFDWLKWVYRLFSILIIASIPLIFMPVGYLRNGHAFQGLTNQPNMLGIILALFFAILLTKLQLKKYNNNLFAYTILGIVLYLGILSKSRTSLITMTLLIIIYLIFLKTNLLKKVLVYNLIGVFLIVYLILDKQILYEIQGFLYKGQENILYSRISQIDGLVSNFMRNPFFGSGFAVPVTPYRSFAFNTEYVVEPGNLILSVLSYGGILGLILFLFYIITIFRTAGKNFRQTIFLFLAPILISMGEMVFFSSNNIGIWCYMFIALSMIATNDCTNKVGEK